MRDVAGVVCLVLGIAALVALIVGLARPQTFARRGAPAGAAPPPPVAPPPAEGAAGAEGALPSAEGAAPAALAPQPVAPPASAPPPSSEPTPTGPRPRTLALALVPIAAGFLVLGWVLLIAPAYSVTLDPGEQVVAAPGSVIVAQVDNQGMLDGTCEATPKLDDAELDACAVESPAGEKASGEIALPDDLAAGPHTLEYAGETLEFTALTPPEYKVGKLNVDPGVQKVKAPVAVTVTVRNEGEATGTFAGVLKVNGKEAASSDVEIGGGSSRLVDFEFERPKPGACKLDVDGSKGKAVIVKPVRLANGTVLKNSLGGGVGKLVLDNRYRDDCMICLTTSKSSKQPALSVYVRGRDKATISGLRDGEYWAYYSVGDDWNRYTSDFLTSFTRERFAKPVPFTTKHWTSSYTDWSAWTKYTTYHTQYTYFTLTFGSAKGNVYGVPVSEKGFPAPD
jgi:hypothetical protein